MNKYLILIAAVVLFAAGCTSSEDYILIEEPGALKKHAGENVIVTGNISNIIWQHIMGHFEEYPYDYYFDIGDSQIVIYSKKPINTDKTIRVYGEVVEISGKAKGDPRKDYSEYHILVDHWEKI